MWPWSAPRAREATAVQDASTSDAIGIAGSDGGGAFLVRVDRSGGQALGIEVIAASADTIEVKAIKAGGLVETWNQTHPSEAIRPGDAIVRVNGHRGPGLPETFLREIHRLEPLEFVVKSTRASADALQAETERLAERNRTLRAELDSLTAAGAAFRRGGVTADAGPEFFSMDTSPTVSACAAAASLLVDEVTSRSSPENEDASPASVRPSSSSPAPTSPERQTPGPLPLPRRDPLPSQSTAMSPLPTSPGNSSLSRCLSGSGGSRRGSRRSLLEVQLIAQDRRLGTTRPALRCLRAEAGELLELCRGLAGEVHDPEGVAELERLRGLLKVFEQPLSSILFEAETALDHAMAFGEEASRSLRSASTPRRLISGATPRSSLAATPRTEERRRSSLALEGAEALLLRRASSSSISPTAGLRRAVSSPVGGCLMFDSPASSPVAEPRQPQEAPDKDVAPIDDTDSETVLQLAQVAEELTDALEEAQGAEWEARRRLEEASRRLQAEKEANARREHAEDRKIASLTRYLAEQAAATEAERERAAGLELEFMRLELQTALAHAKTAELAGNKGFSASWRYKT